MLSNLPVRFSIAAADMARARRFYVEKLGITPLRESEFGLFYESGGAQFAIVPNPESAGKASYSLMTWLVDNLDTTMAELRSKGVVFEEYDFPFLKTVNGVAAIQGDRIAWFKDSEGNLLALAQLGAS
jgi:catechol 2,3-dioxygenase-like lactoylglutathione lyase family enzyme